jgi:TolB-like protein/class 3 adenylate cyclase/Tfp pilus assembly protein PilF
MQHVDAEVLAFEGYTLDLTRGCVRNESAEIELRPKSFELLRYLVSNRGRLISKDELVTAVWPHVIVSDDSLAQCISDIRRALNDPDRRIIKTVPRRGYLFAATLSVPPRDHAIDQRAGDISDAAEQDPGAEGGLALAPASSNQQGHFTKTRRLAAVLAADVAGYSRLMGADEEGTLDRLKAHRREVFDPKIKEHRGRVVKTTGDGMLVEFPSVVDAARCAVEVQRSMIDRNAKVPDDKRITFRVGINLGDVIVDGEDIYGDGVNIAARLEAFAEPGGICISRVVHDQIRDKLPYLFEDMGEQSAKNIARPVGVYALPAAAVASTPLVEMRSQPDPVRQRISPHRAAIAASVITAIGIGIALWWTWPRRDAPTVPLQPPVAAGRQIPPVLASIPTPRLSIVVLPFTNLSNDADQEYFADGITDDLTTDLSRIADSFVIARNTAFTYKGKAVDAKQIGRDLGVRYVVEGSVRRRDDQILVNVQLIDAETGAHLWADRLETDRRHLAEAQSEITGRLARMLDAEFVRDSGRRIERERAVDLDARDLVMHGWAWLSRPYSAANNQSAQRDFERALEIDPESVEARIGLATILLGNIGSGWSEFDKRTLAKVELLLLEVFERDPKRSNAHIALGILRRDQVRLREAKVEFEEAIALDRNNARAYFQLGQTLMWLGQPEAGVAQFEKAIRLNPDDPNLASSHATLGLCHLLLGHLDQAIDLLRKARAENPRQYYIHLWLAGALGLKGDLDEGKAALAESLKLKPEISSFAAQRANVPWAANPPHWALREKTLNIGLRRIGFPET